ncbi:MAG: hypothetical protein L6Q51_03295 [Cyclobacteriaceae bacterium]|nr:hypothetical protein [Cyclobacteriaceae bacterium]
MGRLILRLVAAFLILCFAVVSVFNRLPYVNSGFSNQSTCYGTAAVQLKNIVQFILEEKEGQKESEKQFIGLDFALTSDLKPSVLTTGFSCYRSGDPIPSLSCPRYLFNCSLLI